ncbi:unnamed protein product [Meloidogyne enterolobii]|uniref:Uncharacterized protein n=1 Tax=Meloidogyne enterolobii TaxID=390850 RepID=A0ACB0YHT5_MELEN
MYIQTTKGRQPEKVLEIQTMIQNKRRELASKGKYVQGKSNNCAGEETNFVDLVDYYFVGGINFVLPSTSFLFSPSPSLHLD